MSKDEMRFCYLRDPEDSRRVLSIGRVLDKSNGQVQWLYCVNDPRDQFCRKISRHILKGRMSNHTPNTLMVKKDMGIIISILDSLSKDESPSRARKIAKFYLPKFKEEQAHRQYINDVLPPLEEIKNPNMP